MLPFSITLNSEFTAIPLLKKSNTVRREAVARGAAIQGLLGESLPTLKCYRHYGVASAPRILLNHESSSQSAEFTSMPMEWDVHWVLGKV